MSSLSSIMKVLTSAGLSGTTLSTAVQSIVGNSPNTAVRAICTVILANSDDMEIVNAEALKLAEVPNLPASINHLLPTLKAAKTPLDVVNAVQAIETALGPQSFFNFG